MSMEEVEDHAEIEDVAGEVVAEAGDEHDEVDADEDEVGPEDADEDEED